MAIDPLYMVGLTQGFILGAVVVLVIDWIARRIARAVSPSREGRA